MPTWAPAYPLTAVGSAADKEVVRSTWGHLAYLGKGAPSTHLAVGIVGIDQGGVAFPSGRHNSRLHCSCDVNTILPSPHSSRSTSPHQAISLASLLLFSSLSFPLPSHSPSYSLPDCNPCHGLLPAGLCGWQPSEPFSYRRVRQGLREYVAVRFDSGGGGSSENGLTLPAQ